MHMLSKTNAFCLNIAHISVIKRQLSSPHFGNGKIWFASISVYSWRHFNQERRTCLSGRMKTIRLWTIKINYDVKLCRSISSMMSPKHSFLIYDQSKPKNEGIFYRSLVFPFHFPQNEDGDGDHRMSLIC